MYQYTRHITIEKDRFGDLANLNRTIFEIVKRKYSSAKVTREGVVFTRSNLSIGTNHGAEGRIVAIEEGDNFKVSFEMSSTQLFGTVLFFFVLCSGAVFFGMEGWDIASIRTKVQLTLLIGFFYLGFGWIASKVSSASRMGEIENELIETTFANNH